MKEPEEPRLLKMIFADFRTFIEELFSGKLFATIRRDYNDLKEFYFDKYRRERLGKKNIISRTFVAIFWLLKMMLVKLASLRRVLVVVALIFLISSIGSTDNQSKIFMGVFLLLFVILLELKDKLLARQELEAGRSIQQALSPVRHPESECWDIFLVTEPANDVGGDLVDFFALENGRYAIALGDVAGKGLAAALLMAKLQATLRALITETVTLPELGRQINRIFFRDSLPDRFASLCVFLVQKSSGQVSLINAGHLPPLILKGEHITEIKKGETALGLMNNTKYHEQKISLAKDELLFCYSDGVCEARNENEQFFPEKRLHDYLINNRQRSASEIGSGLLDVLHSFIGNTPQFDDISFIILKRTA